MAGGHTCFGDPGKMARVIAWLNLSTDKHNSDGDADTVTPTDDTSEWDAVVQLSDLDRDSSLPWPPSPPNDDEDEQQAMPFRPNEAICLMNGMEEVSHGRVLSLDSIKRVLGIRHRALRASSSGHRDTRRRAKWLKRF